MESDAVKYLTVSPQIKKAYEDLLTNNFVDKPAEDGGECKKPQTTEKEALDAILGAIVAQENQTKIHPKNMHAKILITAEELAAKDTEYLKATQYYALKEQQALQNFQYLKGQQWTVPPVTGQGQAITNATSGNAVIYNDPLAAWITVYDQWAGNSGLGAANQVQPAPPTADLMPTPPKPALESMEALYKGSCFDPESEKHLKFDGQVLLLGEEVEAKKSKTKAKSWAEAIAKVKMGDLNMSNDYTAGMDVAEKEPIKATQYYTDYKPTTHYNWEGYSCTEAAYNFLSNFGNKAALYNKDGVMMTGAEYYG